MSVATKNHFAMLDLEDASRPSSPAQVPPDQAPATSPAPAPSRGNQKSRGGPGSRGGRYYQRGGARTVSKDVDQPQGASEEPSSEPRKFENGRGRGRGRGGERGGGRGGRRPFDRHSQTGKTDSGKKIHQGWGGDDGNQEFKAEQAATVDAAAEGGDTWAGGNTGDWGSGGGGGGGGATQEWGSGDATQAQEWGSGGASQDWGSGGATQDWGSGDPAPAEPTAPAPAEEDKEKAENKPRREEEDDNTLTFDQYLAKQKEKEVAVPKIEAARRPNEGTDENIWKDAVPLTKNEDAQSYFVGKVKSAPKARAKKEEKIFIEIDARLPERGGRGRGRGDRGRGRGDRPFGERGRGGGRGRGGRGGHQNGPGAHPEIDVADEAAFPSLA